MSAPKNKSFQPVAVMELLPFAVIPSIMRLPQLEYNDENLKDVVF